MSNEQYIETLKEEIEKMKTEQGHVLSKHKEDAAYGNFVKKFG